MSEPTRAAVSGLRSDERRTSEERRGKRPPAGRAEASGGHGMTGFAVQTGLFFRRKLLETLRQPVWIITGLTTPVLYLALFAPLLRPLAGGWRSRRGTCSTCSCQGSWC